jgi:hypothetical protein
MLCNVPHGTVGAQRIPACDEGTTGYNLCAQRFHGFALRCSFAGGVGVFYPRVVDMQFGRPGGDGSGGNRFRARMFDGLRRYRRSAAGKNKEQAGGKSGHKP